MKNKVLKTDKNNNFSLNSVNGGHSFFSQIKFDFFYSKHHPNVHGIQGQVSNW